MACTQEITYASRTVILMSGGIVFKVKNVYLYMERRRHNFWCAAYFSGVFISGMLRGNSSKRTCSLPKRLAINWGHTSRSSECSNPFSADNPPDSAGGEAYDALLDLYSDEEGNSPSYTLSGAFPQSFKTLNFVFQKCPKTRGVGQGVALTGPNTTGPPIHAVPWWVKLRRGVLQTTTDASDCH